jgi:hypothetical protein
MRPSKDWFIQKYWTERLDLVQIARELSCDPKTAWQWMKDYEIKTRKRGFGHPQNLFVTGEPSAFKGHKHSSESLKKIDQATRARGGVPYLKNGVHWLKQPGAKPANWKGGITPERQTFYRSAEWKQCARTVWIRQKGICQRCGLKYRKVRGSHKFDLHHVDSFQIVERRADSENIMLLCKTCHYWTHSKANAERLYLGRGHTAQAQQEAA